MVVVDTIQYNTIQCNTIQYKTALFCFLFFFVVEIERSSTVKREGKKAKQNCGTEKKCARKVTANTVSARELGKHQWRKGELLELTNTFSKRKNQPFDQSWHRYRSCACSLAVSFSFVIVRLFLFFFPHLTSSCSPLVLLPLPPPSSSFLPPLPPLSSPPSFSPPPLLSFFLLFCVKIDHLNTQVVRITAHRQANHASTTIRTCPCFA